MKLTIKRLRKKAFYTWARNQSSSKLADLMNYILSDNQIKAIGDLENIDFTKK